MSDGELRDYYERYYTFDSLLDLYFETIDEKEMLKQQLQQKENIIKEVREYIKSNEFIGRIRLSSENKETINKLLKILDKEDK